MASRRAKAAVKRQEPDFVDGEDELRCGGFAIIGVVARGGHGLPSASGLGSSTGVTYDSTYCPANGYNGATMKFRIIGAERQTGDDVDVVVEEPTASSAEDRANRMGVLVERIDALTPDESTAINIITVRGKPLWFAATIAVGLLTAWLVYANKKSPLSPPTAIEDWEPDVSVSRPLAQVAAALQGLGWSLGDFEAAWGSRHHWRWIERDRLKGKAGISYLARNDESTQLMYHIIGPRDDLTTFTAGVTLNLEDVETDQDFFSWVSAPLLMVSRVTGVSFDALSDWAGFELGQYAATAKYEAQVSETRWFGGHRVTYLFSPGSDGLTIAFSVKRPEL